MVDMTVRSISDESNDVVDKQWIQDCVSTQTVQRETVLGFLA